MFGHGYLYFAYLDPFINQSFLTRTVSGCVGPSLKAPPVLQHCAKLCLSLKIEPPKVDDRDDLHGSKFMNIVYLPIWLTYLSNLAYIYIYRV